MVKILVVDDHALVRRGVIRILEQSTELQVSCTEAGHARDALRLAATGGYDLVLLDIALPEANGLEHLKALCRGQPKLPIIVLSMYPEEQYAIRAFTLGAAGYLCKESAPEELVRAVLKVLAGATSALRWPNGWQPISPRVRKQVAHPTKTSPTGNLPCCA